MYLFITCNESFDPFFVFDDVNGRDEKTHSSQEDDGNVDHQSILHTIKFAGMFTPHGFIGRLKIFNVRAVFFFSHIGVS